MKNINLSEDENKDRIIKLIIRITAIVLLIITVTLFTFTIFLRHCENNHRYFIFNTRIHAVKPRIYDAHYNPGTLVFVKPAPVRELDEGTLISMATSGTFPLTYNNEKFISFQEEFFGRSLHGIVTENTVARDRLPLRAGRYIGVPYMGVPALGSILLWTNDNFAVFTFLSLLLVASATAALIYFKCSNKNYEKSENLTFSDKKAITKNSSKKKNTSGSKKSEKEESVKVTFPKKKK